MIDYPFFDVEAARALATIQCTKDIFTTQGIKLDEKFSKTEGLGNGMSRYTWDDGKDFTDENNRLEFNKLMFDARNSKSLNPRIKQLWETRK